MQHLGKNLVIALSLLAAGFLAAWFRFGPYLDAGGRYTDGAREYVALFDEPVRYAVWDAPERLAGEVNTAADESRPALSPDGRWLVFAVGERGLNADLWIAELENGRAQRARSLEELNGERDELAPAFGNGELLFASDRAGGAGGLDLWRASFDDGAFGHAEPLAGGVNTRVDETDPAPLSNGGALAFASNRDAPRGSGYDLFFAVSRALESFDVQPLTALNSPADEREPAFTADGRTLVFASDRERARSHFDLYRSLWDRGAWLPPEPLAGVNGPASERGPSPSLDGFTLLFSAESPDGSSDLFRARSLELFRQPAKPVGWLELALLAALLLLALLALLAKRWDTLEVVYKCFLVSVLVHLLMLWWFDHLHPESEPVDLLPGERTFDVRLERGAASAPPSSRERGGALEMVPSASATEALGPERREIEEPAEAAALAAPLELARAEQRTEALPAAEGAAAAPASATTAEVALREEERSAPIYRGEARELALDARASARVESVEHASPALARAPAEAGSIDAQPLERELAVVADRGSRAEPLPSGGGTPADVQPSASMPGAAQVATAAPNEAFPLARGGAAELALAARGFDPRGAEAIEASSHAAHRVVLAAAPLELGASAPRSRELALPENVGADGGPRASESALGPAPIAASLELHGPANEPAQHGSEVGTETLPAGLALDARRFAPDEELGEGSSASPARSGSAVAGTIAPPSSGPALRALAPHGSERLESVPTPAKSVVAPSNGTSLPRVALTSPPTERARAENTPSSATSAGVEGSENADLLALADIATARETTSGSISPRRFEPVERTSAPPAPPRFRALETAEPVALDSAPAVPDAFEHTPYRTRFGLAKELALEEHGGSRETEAAVARGLAYLAHIQRSEGYWGDVEARDEKYGFVLVGKTGLCLLAFLGAGHTQDSATEHSRLVQRTLDFLLAIQDEASGHFGYCSSYGHGIATYALAECYALTRDERLRRPLERAVGHILERQARDYADARSRGGWGYYYPAASDWRGDDWPRVSITAWQVMALESARLGGIAVPDRAFAEAKGFLQRAWDEARGAFRYTHQPSRLSSVYPVLPGSTPAALFALSLLGEDLGAERYAPALRYVTQRTPDGYRYTGEEDFVARARGNLYFWYYSTLALFRRGGSDWERWNERMKETLVPAQEEDGSWQPIEVYAEYARDGDGDRSYTTSLCVLTLEIYYRYFTPLLRVGMEPLAAEAEDPAAPLAR